MTLALVICPPAQSSPNWKCLNTGTPLLVPTHFYRNSSTHTHSLLSPYNLFPASSACLIRAAPGQLPECLSARGFTFHLFPDTHLCWDTFSFLYSLVLNSSQNNFSPLPSPSGYNAPSTLLHLDTCKPFLHSSQGTKCLNLTFLHLALSLTC